MRVDTFNLEFKNDGEGRPFFAPFPFVFNGVPVEGFSCGVSSRFMGDMKFERDNPKTAPRLALFDKLGLDADRVFGLKQVHSKDVLVVDKNNPPSVDADGMVTCDRRVILSVTVADCLPVFLLDVKSHLFGIVHSGWKGTGIVLAAIRIMKEKWGAAAGDIAAVLGPCIGACCYKVDAQRAWLFENEYGSEAVRKDGSDFFLDLNVANVKLLLDAGVKNIAVCNDCTYSDERLGSFRREGEKFVRMAALVGENLWK
jgi:YfiH family protein